MAAGLDFEIEGLEELERDLTKAIQTAPEKAKETLKELSANTGDKEVHDIDKLDSGNKSYRGKCRRNGFSVE